MEFADGATCSFTMTAFTPMEHRRTRLFGTHGYIDGDGETLRVVDFRTGKEETVDTLSSHPPPRISRTADDHDCSFTPRAARHVADVPGMATGSRAADADEQSRSRSCRTS